MPKDRVYELSEAKLQTIYTALAKAATHELNIPVKDAVNVECFTDRDADGDHVEFVLTFNDIQKNRQFKRYLSLHLNLRQLRAEVYETDHEGNDLANDDVWFGPARLLQVLQTVIHLVNDQSQLACVEKRTKHPNCLGLTSSSIAGLVIGKLRTSKSDAPYGVL